MTYKSLMVHLQPTRNSLGRLKIAIDLAERFASQLIAFTSAQIIEPPTPSAVLLLPTRDHRLARFKLAFDNLHELFDVEARDVRRDWRAAMADAASFAAENARAADLIILGRSPEDEPDQGFKLEPAQLLMTAGRPLLLVPPDVEKLSADRIVVAWKAGRHTRLAIHQALPLLVRAASVTVLGVGVETSREELDDVTAYLKLHGASASSEWRSRSSSSVADVLLGVATDNSADIIVSGGYGHSRVQEWVLGGVTQDLLTTSPICCLMSH